MHGADRALRCVRGRAIALADREACNQRELALLPACSATGCRCGDERTAAGVEPAPGIATPRRRARNASPGLASGPRRVAPRRRGAGVNLTVLYAGKR